KKRYELQGDVNDLHAAYTSHLKCDELIQSMTRFYKQQDDLLTLSEKTSEIYGGAISTCYDLYQITRDETYLHKAFYFSEQNKAGSLLQSIAKIDALEFAGIPDSILALEHRLRIDRTYFNSKYNELLASSNAATEVVETARKKWLQIEQDHQELIAFLEVEYPKYYELKYQVAPPSVESVQDQLVNDQTALIEFFVADSSIFVFTITQEVFSIHKVLSSQGILTQLTDLRSAILEPAMGKPSLDKKQETSQVPSHYVYTATHLYDLLLAPSIATIDTSITKLVIIPDNKLGYLPFELLLTQPSCPEETKFGDLPYLLKDFVINHGYSSRLLMTGQHTRGEATYTYAGFAPFYEDNVYLSEHNNWSENTPLKLALREGFNDLPAARQSITRISRSLSGDAYINDRATEANFKENAPNYNILHLAMHGVVDDQNPLYSKLIFSPSESDGEDNYLNAMELYNMQLNAEMAVLGACNTAYGEWQRGEGIMSLSRAFAYAGCPSVVASLWSIPDEATAQLTQHFFAELVSGQDKDEALRNAKLAYLASNPNRLTAPFFWAGFVHIGASESIQLNARPEDATMLPIISLVFLSVIAFATVFWRRRSASSSLISSQTLPS
ncbi:MAG: CHAT domain-containing protein, partial [Bacteroidota bacterium]